MRQTFEMLRLCKMNNGTLSGILLKWQAFCRQDTFFTETERDVMKRLFESYFGGIR